MIPSPQPLTKDTRICITEIEEKCKYLGGKRLNTPPQKPHVHSSRCLYAYLESSLEPAVRLAEQKMMTDFDMLGKIKYEGFTLRDEELARSKNEGARREILRCLGKLREAFPVAYDDPKGESSEETK